MQIRGEQTAAESRQADGECSTVQRTPVVEKMVTHMLVFSAAGPRIGSRARPITRFRSKTFLITIQEIALAEFELGSDRAISGPEFRARESKLRRDHIFWDRFLVI